MNDHQSSLGRMDDEGSTSPKRKKIRQKYAPKACVSCRRSKLKCSGEVPCQRCRDNNKRCFYSEDQTAAEVLQNLSRPAPVQPTQPSSSNGARRNILPRHDAIERRASDASNIGMTMEGRMARIEVMMEALIHERGLTLTPRGSIERDETASDGPRSEAAFSMPLLDPIHPALAQIGQPSPEHMPPPMFSTDPSLTSETTNHIRVGNRMMPFPEPAKYQEYMVHFFGDIHLRHPCIDEVEFNARTQRVVSTGVAGPSDYHFLAFCYTVFALCDVLLDVNPLAVTNDTKPRGWHWCQLAESLVEKESLLSGRGDLALVQFLFFQALYFTHADLPALAYNAMRLACTATLQQNIHQRMTWPNIDSEQLYWRVCLFWNVYITDRSISLSCGRPTSFQIEDTNVEMPAEFCERASVLEQHRDDLKSYINQYLKFMVWWAQLSSTTVSRVLKGDVPDGRSSSTTETLMTQFLEKELPHVWVPYAQPEPPAYSTLKTFMTISPKTVVLIVGRKTMTSLTYNRSQAEYFGQLALHTIGEMRYLRREAEASSSCRHQMTSAVASALLTLGALLVHDLSLPELVPLQANLDAYQANFKEAASIMEDLARGLPYARRVLGDCRKLINSVSVMIRRWEERAHNNQASQDWVTLMGLKGAKPGNLFPYQASSPQLRLKMGEPWEGMNENSSFDVLWLL